MNTSLDSMFGIDQGGPVPNEQWNLALYQRYLLLMDAIASSAGTELAVFIQPTPARFRTITTQEAGLVGDLSYGPDFQAMEKSLLSLDGLPIYSLAHIYENISEPIYSDAIHQPIDGVGYQVMVNEIAILIGQNWRLDVRGQ